MFDYEKISENVINELSQKMNIAGHETFIKNMIKGELARLKNNNGVKITDYIGESQDDGAYIYLLEDNKLPHLKIVRNMIANDKVVEFDSANEMLVSSYIVRFSAFLDGTNVEVINQYTLKLVDIIKKL